MRKKVLILMSTYNGGKKVERQVKSLLCQENVDVSLNIRDDGSTDSETLEILDSLKRKNSGKLHCAYGKNIGWKQSFMELLSNAGCEYDYYGFSDQDDIWMSHKIISLIQLMEDGTKGVKLAHCNSISVDKELKFRTEQEKRTACPPNYKIAISTEYFQGCGMVWNKEAMKLIKKYRPQNKELSHDYWVGLLCYLMGQIYFCEEPQFLHIRYGNNASDDGNVYMGRVKRLKCFLSGKTMYMNPAHDLLLGYDDMIDSRIKEFLKILDGYREDTKKKWKLLLDAEFRRPSIAATGLLKIAILMNRF